MFLWFDKLTMSRQVVEMIRECCEMFRKESKGALEERRLKLVRLKKNQKNRVEQNAIDEREK